ncbi:MAG: discoidin domain-containing protein [Candidatus Omnitrophica bacterium]|nr:discoidin domain-containing protein [Candidatus Omnitrophota bacterium]
MKCFLATKKIKLIRSIFAITLLFVFIAFFHGMPVLAKEKMVEFTAKASSTYGNYPKYGADKVADGDINTFWVGGRGEASWWIGFEFEKTVYLKETRICWYPSAYYAPDNYDIQISEDGIDWEDIHTGLVAEYGSNADVQEIGRYAKYMRFNINSVRIIKRNGRKIRYYPAIKEVEAYAGVYVPHSLRFQGRLMDSADVMLDGEFEITFRLYDSQRGGIPAWEETQNNLYIERGLLDVELGSVIPIDLSFDRQYWLGIEVESDGEMAPRFKMTSVPYALCSEE